MPDHVHTSLIHGLIIWLWVLVLLFILRAIEARFPSSAVARAIAFLH